MVKVVADLGLWKRKTNIVPSIFVLSLRTVSNSAFRFQWQNVEIMCGLLGVEVHKFSRHDLQQVLSVARFFSWFSCIQCNKQETQSWNLRNHQSRLVLFSVKYFPMASGSHNQYSAFLSWLWIFLITGDIHTMCRFSYANWIWYGTIFLGNSMSWRFTYSSADLKTFQARIRLCSNRDNCVSKFCKY